MKEFPGPVWISSDLPALPVLEWRTLVIPDRASFYRLGPTTPRLDALSTDVGTEAIALYSQIGTTAQPSRPQFAEAACMPPDRGRRACCRAS